MPNKMEILNEREKQNKTKKTNNNNKKKKKKKTETKVKRKKWVTQAVVKVWELTGFVTI